MKLVFQSIVLLASLALVYVWQNTEISSYTIQILGFLIFIFILLSARKRGKSITNSITGNSSITIFTLNTVILLLIFSTGGFDSSLFFLLYFLGFGIAFIFKPQTVFVFAIGAFFLFLPNALKENTMENLIRIGSLLIISPLAFFFGREYSKGEKQDEEIHKIKERSKDAADTISEDVEEIMHDKKANLGQKDLEKLNEILEETDDLRTESKE